MMFLIFSILSNWKGSKGVSITYIVNKGLIRATSKKVALGKTALHVTKCDCYRDLEQLGLSYVDLMLVHFPPVGNTLHCAAMQEQWRALETFYRARNAPRHRRRGE